MEIVLPIFMSLQQCYINGLLAGSLMSGVCCAIPAEETSAVGALPEYSSEEQECPAHMPFMAEHVRKLLAPRCFLQDEGAEAVTRTPVGLSASLRGLLVAASVSQDVREKNKKIDLKELPYLSKTYKVRVE